MALVLFALLGASRAPGELVIRGDGLVVAHVNGQSATLRADPAAPGMPLIDIELAWRAKLKMTESWGVSIGFAVGKT